MNSNQMKHATVSILGAGALTLSLMGARAQVIPTPYTTNRVNMNTQSYSTFGETNSAAAFTLGALNNGYGYGYYGLGGSTSPLASAAYFGYGLPNLFGGYPYGYAVNGSGTVYAGSNISVADTPLSGGFAFVNPNGAVFVGPNGQPSDPDLTNGGTITSVYGRTGGINRIYGRKNRNVGAQTTNVAGTDATTAAPVSLNQLISAQQDANFNLRIRWLGDPTKIETMNVTLLNQYHLPVASNTASNGSPVTFAASRDMYAARYYRVDIQFADGAVTTMTGTVKR